jgi:glycosyltransferase involved in cell wall biosynthesis
VVRKVSNKFSDVKFIWVGGHEIQMFNMNREIKKYSGLSNNVELIGYTNDIFYYYQKASIYFQPSLSENHSIAVIDAMAAGLPCVVSNVGGMRESVSNNKTGFLVKPKDVTGFVEKIIILLENEELARNLGSKGKIVAKKLFSEKIQMENFANLYNELGNKHKNELSTMIY